MIEAATARRAMPAMAPVGRQRAMVDFLRAMVLDPHSNAERFHAVFLDRHNSYLGDAPMGNGGIDRLSLRMREVLGRALSHDAQGILIAHNHPSGHCRPSQIDIDATSRLKAVAKALDIELLDHLIFTHDAVYSMRAGGKL
ncbi:JAB domain-containing protein [Qipengyuania sp. ASV99]|uniref:JAB domain-containing protein n=1 Tax=Qipengyuania sp. ASV99 TaxID=3399681 RepID=UPI003A4C7F25